MEPIVGPGGRYRVRFELLQDAGNGTYLRRRSGEGRRQGAEWLVLLGEEATARLTLGEGGITLHSLGLAQPGRAILQAEIEAGPGAPAWMSANATMRLFEGDRQAAAALRDRFVPFPGAVEPSETAASGELPLDQLFVAVGRSVARANRLLVEIESPGGTALITTVTVSVSLESLTVERGRAVVKPVGQAEPQVNVAQSSPTQTWMMPAPPQPTGAQGGTESPGAFVQFTLALAPGAEPSRGGESATPSVSTGAPASSQSLVGVPMRRK